MKRIDQFLNLITMYRLLVSGLLVLAVYSVILASVGILPNSGFSYVLSLIILLPAGYWSNYFWAKIFQAPVNSESTFITSLILFFILSPAVTPIDGGILFFASVLASSSKYFLALEQRHLFNPAAIAVFLLSLFGSGNAIWWVASPWLIIPVLIFGLMVVHKLRLRSLFLSFVLSSIFLVLFISWPINLVGFGTIVQERFISWPLIFLGTVMLTEPFTLPPHRRQQVVYGIIVAFFSTIPFNFGLIYSTPELALILGNIFSYFVAFKRRVILTLSSVKNLAKDIYEFSFYPSRPFSFLPGQYMEWTLAHRNSDSRGDRRYFTIASSPTEGEIKLGLKFSNPTSSFKSHLKSFNLGDKIVAGQLAGDFVLPKDSNKRLVFIAGGIGVTPFRSMLKYLIDCQEKRNVILFYSAKTELEFAYRDVFSEAEREIGLKTVYLITEQKPGLEIGDNFRLGFITAELIKKEVADYPQCLFYLSGPSVMVQSYLKLLKSLKIPRSQIVTDYFPGF